MNKGYWHGILAAIVISLITIVVILASFINGTRQLDQEPAVALNDNWQYNWEGSSDTNKVRLPATIDGAAPNRILHIQNKLPDITYKNACLFIRTSQQYIRVFINGQPIYQYVNNPDRPEKSPGSSYHFITLPKDYSDGRVDIYLSSPLTPNSGVLNEIFIGNPSSHIFYILNNYSFKIVTSAAILVIGVILIIFFLALSFFGAKFENIFYLGMFSLLSGIWMLCESRVIELIIQNPILLLNVAFISQFLMPIPILAFIYSTYEIQDRVWLKFFTHVFAIFFVISSLLNLFHIVEYIEIMMGFHFIVLLCIGVLIGVSVKELIAGNKTIKLFFFGCILLCFFSLVDIFIFYFSESRRSHALNFFQMGLLIFVIITIVSLAQNIFVTREKQISHEILLSLAFTDILTGFKNRTAFEGRITEINRKLDTYSSINLIIMDINGLKHINDNYGHKEGDRLIIEGAKIIDETLGILGELYRIGGDEFAIIITDMEPYFIHMEIETLNKKIAAFNETQEKIKISIAYGIDAYIKDRDIDLQSVFVRADRAMYVCKENQKCHENK